MNAQQRSLVESITWLTHVAALVRETKLGITARVSAAEDAIAALETANLRGEVRQKRIDSLIAAAYDANVADVAAAAAVARFSDWTLPEEQYGRALESLIRSNPAPSPAPPSGTATSQHSSSEPSGEAAPRMSTVRNTGDHASADPESMNETPQPAVPTQSTVAPVSGQTHGTADPETVGAPSPPPMPIQETVAPVSDQTNITQTPSPMPSAPSPIAGNHSPATRPVVASPPATPLSTGGPKGSPGVGTTISGGQSPSGIGGTTGGAPQAPAATASPGAGAGQAPVSTPQQDFQKGFADVTKAANANPMPVNQTPLSPATPASAPAAPLYPQPDTTGSTTPAAATNHSAPVTNAPTPATPATPAAPTGAPPMPLGNPSTPAPAAPVPPTAGPAGPTLTPASTNQGATGGAAAPVPISAARAERDAMAAAATPGALRRQGNNPRQLARHIAAALNVDTTDPSLYWITAVTSDGHILAANNYGLAYIPEHVHLPEQVRMVTADESIPAQTRGTWATYPLLAVQEWARHHNVTLQAVAGTEENLKGFDLGAARDILSPDDLPDSGKMQGRNRLEVIAPEVATKLAGISAGALTELLPPAPADNTPPPDNRMPLLLEVCKPLLSANPDRAGAHLKAMVNYADHLQTVALHRAHHAQDAELQRAAIADWIYWQHVSVLSSDALSAMVS